MSHLVPVTACIHCHFLQTATKTDRHHCYCISLLNLQLVDCFVIAFQLGWTESESGNLSFTQDSKNATAPNSSNQSGPCFDLSILIGERAGLTSCQQCCFVPLQSMHKTFNTIIDSENAVASISQT